MSVETAKHRELGLTDSEFELIVEKLGREPNDVELAMFSLLWSEHCAYKHSRKLLRRLPTEGERVVMGPGENAGAVDVGNGYAVAFKVESHNHPSAVEPFQGAATGVGGILRDVFALGARPIAILDSLRFGELDSVRSRHLLDGAVRGIGHYGNSIGVPTVGGEIYFEAPYEHNCLVNAMCVGLAKTEEMVRAAAAGVGNAVVLMGASTGRDGIGGASVLASAELGEGDEAKRPTVQIGDPFEESKVLECCLELLEKGLLVSLQDLGAAGLTSSAGRDGLGRRGRDRHRRRPGAAARGRHGALRDHGLRVAGADARRWSSRRRVAEVLAVCEKWQTGSAEIGVVTDSGQIRILRDGEVVGDMPVEALVDGCPLYDLEPAEPEGWIYGNRATLARRRLRRGDAAGAARRPQHRLQALGLRAVRLDRRLAHGAPAGVGRRRGPADPRGRQRDRGLDRRQRPPGRLRPPRRHDRGGARVRPEPRLRRRRAARPDQLPQLRQPGEADPRLAARPRGQRPRRGLRARSASRSSAATSRSTTRDRTGRSTRPRWSAWSASCPTRRRVAGSAFAARGRRDRPARPLRPHPRRLGAGEAARRARRGPAAARHRRGRRRLRDRPRRGPRRPARLRPRHQRRRPRLRPGRVARSAPASAAGSTCSPCASAAAHPRRRSSARAPGGFLLSGERATLEALGAV